MDNNQTNSSIRIFKGNYTLNESPGCQKDENPKKNICQIEPTIIVLSDDDDTINLNKVNLNEFIFKFKSTLHLRVKILT
jgi:hypothetical protein